MGIFTDQVPETTKVNYKLISRPEPPTNHRRHSPKETCETQTFDCPPKADQESTPAQNRRTQSKTSRRKTNGCWNQPYLSSSGCQSPNGDLARRFPELFKKRNIHLLNLCNLLSQTFVGDILKTLLQSDKVNCAGAKEVSNKALKGNRGRVVICNAHHLPETLKLRHHPIQELKDDLRTFGQLRQG